MRFAAPFLIIQTGRPVRPMRRYGEFPHWIRVAAGTHADAAVAVDVQRGDALPSSKGFAGAIITGSAAMVTDRYQWSERSAAWLRNAAHAGLPLFGICYGHQLIAHALGGDVGDNPNGREMGTVEVALRPMARQDPLFTGLPQKIFVQATHLQTVSKLPDGSAVLASSQQDACHAFRWGDTVWGVQFHPEFSVAHMRGYLAARRDALIHEGRCARTLSQSTKATPLARGILRRFVRWAAVRYDQVR